jgi:AcrR family transcriptional regulator
MADEVGLRERKKQRTRQALIEAALRLFDEQGYEETTVDQISAAAEISRRTFFSYFPSKEDLLLFGMERRVEMVLRDIAQHRPEEAMIDVLVRAAEHVAANPWGDQPPSGFGSVGLRLLTTVPAVQARVLYRLSLAESEIAEALQHAYPDELDPVTAIAAVGAIMRAGTAAAIATLRHGEPPEQARAAMQRAVHIVGQGLRLAIGSPGSQQRSLPAPPVSAPLTDPDDTTDSHSTATTDALITSARLPVHGHALDPVRGQSGRSTA